LRQKIVQAVRRGQSRRAVARRFNVSERFVRYWYQRAGNKRIDRVKLTDRRTTRLATHNRTGPEIERCVIGLRKYLKAKSALGEYGAKAIYREMSDKNCPVIPSLRTINLILKRNGCLDGKRRVPYEHPPSGWYLSDVASGAAELDSFDYVEDLRLEGVNGFVHIFNGISLHGGLACSFPVVQMTTDNTIKFLLEHWRQFGFPTYAQFDNSTIFTGSRHPNSIGKVIRFCLELNVIPVFAPPRETGFQAKIERYNGLWQKGVWERFHFRNHQHLTEQSRRYVEAFNYKNKDSIQSAPDRYEIPENYIFRYDNLTTIPPGEKIIFIKRTDDKGYANVLGNVWEVDNLWTNRLTRVEILLSKRIVNFYRLRRRDPSDQLLLKTKKYSLQ
jgi:hypothetical protein